METILKIVNRLIGLPFFIILALVGTIILWFKFVINFIIYGGEAISYTEKTQRKTINDVFEEVQKLINEKNSKKPKLNIRDIDTGFFENIDNIKLCEATRGNIAIRSNGKYKEKSLWLPDEYDYAIKKENTNSILIPLKKKLTKQNES